MSNLSYWIYGLPEGTTSYTHGPIWPEPDAICLLHTHPKPNKEMVYLSTAPEAVSYLLETSCEGITLFVSGHHDSLIGLAKSRKINLVMTPLPILELYDHIFRIQRVYQGWARALLEVFDQDIQSVVDVGAGLGNGLLLLLNSAGRIIYHSCQNPDLDYFLPEHFINGKLPSELISAFIGSHTPKKQLSEGLQNCQILKSGEAFFSYAVVKNRNIISYIVLLQQKKDPHFDAESLLKFIRISVSKAASLKGEPHWAGGDFQSLLTNMLEGHVTNEDVLRKECSLLSHPLKQFCTFVLIESADTKVIDFIRADLIAQLELIFPEDNLCIYKNRLLILLSKNCRSFQSAPLIDYVRFQKLLQEYNLFAGFSNATSRRSMLRSNYQMTCAILHLGRMLPRKKNQRMFFFEDYAEYLTIDLCINSFSELFGHDDIIYLTHPEAVLLCRYDQEHKTDLLKVLYYFCMNNGNASQAAKAAYMHRNTFSQRLAKIQELITADILDGAIQQRMIFSYKILCYYECVLKINLNNQLNHSPQPAY